jgi:nucleoside-diphosphate-sugar epimerase
MIELMGNGKSQVDLIFVDDVIAILLAALELQKRGGSVYNLSSGTSRSVGEILETLSRMSGRDPIVRMVDTAPQEFVVDNSRLVEALGGFRFTDLETGLLKTYHEDGCSIERYASEAEAS